MIDTDTTYKPLYNTQYNNIHNTQFPNPIQNPFPNPNPTAQITNHNDPKYQTGIQSVPHLSKYHPSNQTLSHPIQSSPTLIYPDTNANKPAFSHSLPKATCRASSFAQHAYSNHNHQSIHCSISDRINR